MEFESYEEELVYRHQLLVNERNKNYLPQKIGIFQRAINKLTSYFSEKSIWLDFSDWQPNINYQALKGRISGVIIKMFEVDDRADNTNFVQKGWASGVGYCYPELPVIGYVFVNTAWYLNAGHNVVSLNNLFDNEPTDDLKAKSLIDHDPQIRNFIRGFAIGDLWLTDVTALKDGRVRFRKFNGFFLDTERSWMSYNEYYSNQSTYRKVPDFWIGYSTKWLFEKYTWLMDHGYLPKIPLGIYSGKWFIQSFSPLELGTFVQTHDSWVAGYYWNTGSTLTTIEAFRSQYLSAIPDSWRPGLFGNPVRFFQISGDRFKIPEVTNVNGIPVAIDINVSVQGDAQTYAWLGFNPTEIVVPSSSLSPSMSPSPSMPPTNTAVTLANLNVRVGPGVTSALVSTRTTTGKKVTYLQEQKLSNGEVWMEVELGALGTGWLCEGQNGVPYVDKD